MTGAANRGERSIVFQWRGAVCDGAGLTSTAKLVALVISLFMDGRGVAWPSRETIGRRASLDVRSVDRALALLADKGFLVVARPEKHGRGRVNYYTTRIPEKAAQSRPSTEEKGDTDSPIPPEKGDFESKKGDFDDRKGGTESPEVVVEVEEESGGGLRLNGAPPTPPFFVTEVIPHESANGLWPKLATVDNLDEANRIAEKYRAEGRDIQVLFDPALTHVPGASEAA